MAERLQGLLGVTLYLLLVLYFQYPLMRDAFMCLCTGTSLQETKLRTARLITFRPTHPVRSEGSTKQTAGCFTMRQNAMVSGLVNGAGRSQDQLPGFLSPRGQP